MQDCGIACTHSVTTIPTIFLLRSKELSCANRNVQNTQTHLESLFSTALLPATAEQTPDNVPAGGNPCTNVSLMFLQLGKRLIDIKIVKIRISSQRVNVSKNCSVKGRKENKLCSCCFTLCFPPLCEERNVFSQVSA